MRTTAFDPKNRFTVNVTRLVLLFGVIFVWWLGTSQKWLSPFFFGDPVGQSRGGPPSPAGEAR